MGFIERSAGLTNFSQAVISLWFRIPSATVAAGVAAYDSWYVELPILPNSGDLSQGVIPFITFGSRGQSYDGGVEDSGPMMPSVIGLSCRRAWAGLSDYPTLYARFQYATGGSPVVTGYQYPDYFQVGDRLWPAVANNVDIVTETYVEVTPDAWHHLIVSFDLSGGCSAAFAPVSFSTCPFYWALDGTNYNGTYLWPNTPAYHSVSGDDNGIFSDWCNAGEEGAEFSFVAGNLATSGSAVGVPGATTDADNIYNIIMAEMQVYTGVTIDTGIESNLNKFISATGHPVSQSQAATLLGKEPEIYFRTHNDWINGTNSGTAGNFTPTGTVTPFTPTP